MVVIETKLKTAYYYFDKVRMYLKPEVKCQFYETPNGTKMIIDDKTLPSADIETILNSYTGWVGKVYCSRF